MRLKTKTNKLSKKQIRNIIMNTVNWCSNNLGVNNRRRFKFKVSVRKQTSGEIRYGEFNCITNQMIIFYNNCDNIKDLVTTVIHEYTHYLQPVRSYYTTMAKHYGYNNHPMEIEARFNESLFYRKAWKNIKSVL